MFSGSRFTQIKTHLGQILSQGFYQPCSLCERPGSQGFCAECWRQVRRCQTQSSLPTTAPIPPLLVWGRYQNSLKRAIAQMKYQHHPQIATRLGEELGLRWLQNFPNCRDFVTIPIPLHFDRLAERGYNQAELIARRFSQVVGVACLPQGLRRIHQTQAQYMLTREHRAQNLRNAFVANPAALKSSKGAALIIDDIFTTGATVQAATQALQQFNLRVLGTAVVAQAVYEDGSVFK